VTLIVTGNETVQGNTSVTGTATAAKLIPTGTSVTGNGMYLPATNALGFSTNGTNAVYIDASQNVGIGTTSPSFTLDVGGPAANIRVAPSTATNNALTRYVNTGGIGYVGLDNSVGALTAAYALNLYHAGAYPIVFSTSNAERARIDSSGNLLWAKTLVSETTNGIQFATDGTNVGRLSIGGANSSSSTSLSVYSTTASAFRFFVSYSGQINATSTSITAISDESLKENIVDLETGIAEVMALRPRRFDWKEETQLAEKGVAGFIAQEVESVLPELVYDYQYNEIETKKSIKMGDILPTLVKAIQEQQALITSLTARIEALEAK
jgi:hypothetical protein